MFKDIAPALLAAAVVKAATLYGPAWLPCPAKAHWTALLAPSRPARQATTRVKKDRSPKFINQAVLTSSFELSKHACQITYPSTSSFQLQGKGGFLEPRGAPLWRIHLQETTHGGTDGV